MCLVLESSLKFRSVVRYSLKICVCVCVWVSAFPWPQWSLSHCCCYCFDLFLCSQIWITAVLMFFPLRQQGLTVSLSIYIKDTLTVARLKFDKSIQSGFSELLTFHPRPHYPPLHQKKQLVVLFIQYIHGPQRIKCHHFTYSMSFAILPPSGPNVEYAGKLFLNLMSRLLWNLLSMFMLLRG